MRVVGSLDIYLNHLEEEYTKSLQHINPHTSEYVTRLRDESTVVSLAAAVGGYYHRIGDPAASAMAKLLELQHIYYKHDSIALAVHRAQAFSNVYGNPSQLHPACVGGKGPTPEDFTKCHPAAMSGTPSVEAETPDYGARSKNTCLLFIPL